MTKDNRLKITFDDGKTLTDSVFGFGNGCAKAAVASQRGSIVRVIVEEFVWLPNDKTKVLRWATYEGGRCVAKSVEKVPA